MPHLRQAEPCNLDLRLQASLRTAEMAAFFRFFESRMPQLLAEWEETRATG